MATQQPTPAPDRFVRLLKRALGGSGLSLREAAGKAHISPAYLSLLLKGERGVPADEIVANLEEVLNIEPRGLLFDAAGRHDNLASEFFKKKAARPLMRSLGPLNAEELGQVLEVAERLAKKHHPAQK